MTGETPPAAKGVTPEMDQLMADDLVGHIVDAAIIRCRALHEYAGRPAWEIAVEAAIREIVTPRLAALSLPAPGEGEATPVAWLKPSDIERLAKMQRGAINAQIANLSFVGCTVPVYSTPASGGLAVKALTERIDDLITSTYEKDGDGYYDTPLTILLRDIRAALSSLDRTTLPTAEGEKP